MKIHTLELQNSPTISPAGGAVRPRVELYWAEARPDQCWLSVLSRPAPAARP